jgi:nucleotide-binding universal stress UspA family protein
MPQSSFQIHEVLFPTDFSRSSQSAAPHVAGLARSVNAKVSILHVVPWLSGWHGASEPHYVISDDVQRKLQNNQETAEAECLKMLNAVKKKYFEGIECSVRVRTGGVAESIVEHAAETHSDLITIPTRGTGPSRPFLIGSVAAKVLHDARCAVWTTPHPRELEEFRPYRQILCAMDYRVLSRDVLGRAWQLAQLFHSRLSLVTAIPCPAPGPVPCVERQSVRLLKNETESSLATLTRDLSIHAAVHVSEGSVGEVVSEAVAREDADLVVIGRGHLDERSGHLRTHAYEIIWQSPCPVLSL